MVHEIPAIIITLHSLTINLPSHSGSRSPTYRFHSIDPLPLTHHITPHHIGISSHNLHPSSPDPPPRSPQPIHAPLLLPTKPRLQRIPQHALAHKVNDQPANDAHKRNWIHPMNMLVENLDADDDAPEIAREERDVEKGRGSESENHGRPGVEDHQTERVARQVASDFAVVPYGRLVAVSVEDTAHGSIDNHTPKPQLAHDFVERSLADQEFFRHVAHAVERGAH